MPSQLIAVFHTLINRCIRQAPAYPAPLKETGYAIDCRRLAQGIYFAQLKPGGRVITKKNMKE
ncbi:hypothetical protein [Niastella vici]|uniref:hypothetical protein n=1 Tax=Niastella vici TaxID=1703345 RepID=UPI0011807154|nr:hypothetical protein [Niastella vici]